MEVSNEEKAQHLRKLLFTAERLEEAGDLTSSQVRMHPVLVGMERNLS